MMFKISKLDEHTRDKNFEVNKYFIYYPNFFILKIKILRIFFAVQVFCSKFNKSLCSIEINFFYFFFSLKLQLLKYF